VVEKDRLGELVAANRRGQRRVLEEVRGVDLVPEVRVMRRVFSAASTPQYHWRLDWRTHGPKPVVRLGARP